jgi:hypothetical protein
MATAAGLTSPALVSLIKRAQKVRKEMDFTPNTTNEIKIESPPLSNLKEGKKSENWEFCITNSRRGCVILLSNVPIFAEKERSSFKILRKWAKF